MGFSQMGPSLGFPKEKSGSDLDLLPRSLRLSGQFSGMPLKDYRSRNQAIMTTSTNQNQPFL